MSLTTVITMILILAVVWGGFVLAVATAVRKERSKGSATAAALETAAAPETGGETA